MSRKVKIEKLEKSGSLSEIYQVVETRFSFVTAPRYGNKQCHHFAMCRDFLQDAVASQINGNQVSIYGFEYKRGENPPVDLRKTRMLVKKPDNHSAKTFRSHMAHGLKLLNHYEEMAGWTKSRVFPVEGDEGIMLFVGPVHWVKAPFMISLYTLLIRLGSKEIKFDSHKSLVDEYSKWIKTYEDECKKLYKCHPVADKSITEDNDLKYLKECGNHINTMILKTYLIINKSIERNYPPVEVYAMHNSGGILSICTGKYFNGNTSRAFKKATKGMT